MKTPRYFKDQVYLITRTLKVMKVREIRRFNGGDTAVYGKALDVYGHWVYPVFDVREGTAKEIAERLNKRVVHGKIQ